MKKCEDSCILQLSGMGSINAKGQIVIPKEARDRLGLEPGDNVLFLTESSGALIVIPHESLQDLMNYVEQSKGKVTLLDQK